MTFIQLKNPLSQTYFELKKFVLSADFPWYWNPKATPEDVETGEYQDVPFYSHVFLARPRWKSLADKLYPMQQSMLLDTFYPLLDEIVQYNSLNVNSFMRINANCVHPQLDSRITIPHNDHQFEHHNLIIYFTDSGGETILFDSSEELEKAERYYPKEDDIVTFKGLHCMNPPKKDRRVILVATYI
jgi:hypothetical protein